MAGFPDWAAGGTEDLVWWTGQGLGGSTGEWEVSSLKPPGHTGLERRGLLEGLQQNRDLDGILQAESSHLAQTCAVWSLMKW